MIFSTRYRSSPPRMVSEGLGATENSGCVHLKRRDTYITALNWIVLVNFNTKMSLLIFINIVKRTKNFFTKSQLSGKDRFFDDNWSYSLTLKLKCLSLLSNKHFYHTWEYSILLLDCSIPVY